MDEDDLLAIPGQCSTVSFGSYVQAHHGLIYQQDTPRFRPAIAGSSNGLRAAPWSRSSKPWPKTSEGEADRSAGRLYRRHLRRGQKRGLCVGPTKRGKGSKVMAIADRFGLPVALWLASASPHEVTLVEETIDAGFTDDAPDKLIGDKAYDSDELDAKLWDERGIQMIAPNRRNREKSQDGRSLRPYKRRWKVERLFAWLFNFRRLVTRYERHASNFLGMLRLGCIAILLRHF